MASYIDEHELLEIHRANERVTGKLELRIEKLEDVLKNRLSQSRVYPAGTFVERTDYEKLQEDFDELVEIVKTLTSKVIEIALANDLEFDQLGT